jgi:hypothetical protein
VGIGPRKSAHNKTKRQGNFAWHYDHYDKDCHDEETIVFNCILSCKKVNLNPLITTSKATMGPTTPKGKVFRPNYFGPR